jgi:two-component system cell cycle response regulator
MPFRLTAPPLVRAVLLLAATLVAAYVARASLDVGGPATAEAFGRWCYAAVKTLVLFAVVARAVRVREQRTVWILISVWLGLTLTGDQVWQILYSGGGMVPSPSAADPFYVAGYAALLVAVGRFAWGVEREAGPARWLDGLAAGLVVASMGAETVIEPTAGALLQAAYPATQLLVLSVLLSAGAMRGWRVNARWALHVAGTLAYVASDAAAVRIQAEASYAPGGLLEAGWLLGVLLWGLAAWTPRTPLLVHRRGLIDVLLPLGVGIAAATMLVGEAFEDEPGALVSLLAAGALVASLLRSGLTAGENLRLLGHSRHEALTDSLTGVGNRRRLLADLEAVAEPRVLVLFDLDGFKHYNDTFGHAAGDALLRLTGERLAAAAGPGAAYRMGGDEFCVLVAPDPHATAADLGRRLAAELLHETDGVLVSASSGFAILPDEGTEPAAVLKIADRRMYSDKRGGRASAERQSADVLAALLAERDPIAASDAARVVDLAGAVARRLGRNAAETARIERAALLAPAGPQVLRAAPALAPVADLLVAGDPILTACSAFSRLEMEPLDAIAELYRGAGTRYDPDVVDALASEVHTHLVSG